MSGIEVVGIVLGVIPLVVSGLEHYAEGTATIRRIWYAASVFRELSRRLKGESALFRNILTILLGDSVELDMQSRLMDDAGGPTWKSAAVQDALRQRLRDTLPIFLEYVKSISKSLASLKQKLHIEDDGKVPFTDAVSFREAHKRLKFTLKKSEYEFLIKNIHDDVIVLERLVEQTKTMHPLSSDRSARRIPDFGSIRSNASGIFESIQRGLYATCNLAHRASVCLRSAQEEAELNYSGGAFNKENSFRILLHHQSSQPKTQSPPWSIAEAEVRLLQITPVRCDTLQAVSAAARPSGKRAVSFQDTTSTASSTIQTAADDKMLQDIQDLCGSITALRAGQCGFCLGVVGNSPDSRQALYCPRKRLLDQNNHTLLTLNDVLLRKEQHTSPLSNADAYRLAVSLATGMMRYHGTPWLHKDWTKNDITLIARNGKILAEYPFISANVDVQQAQITRPVSKRSPARNGTLFALGILLIELCMKKSIDALHQPEELNDDGTKTNSSDYLAASRIVDSGELSDILGPGWNNVVRHCVYCGPEHPRPELDNVDFQKAVYNNIVSELEDNCRQFFGIGIDLSA